MLKSSSAPHIRLREHPFYPAGGVLLCLALLLSFSYLYYGIRPVLLCGISAATAVATEILCSAVARRPAKISDGTSAVTGALIGAMMSPITPFWVPVMGSLFAVGVAKMPFGGTGRNLFNPAAAGMAFCVICFPTRPFLYPDPAQTAALPLFDTSAVITANSPAAYLSNNAGTAFDWLSLLRGDFPGPIGSTAVAVLIACALYLYIRRSASVAIGLSYFAVCLIGSYLFPRTAATVPALLTELCSGLLLFCGVFLLADPVTAPRHPVARIAYGALAGILVLLLRRFGRFECSEFFAVLLVNAFSALLDRSCWSLTRRIRKRREVSAR